MCCVNDNMFLTKNRDCRIHRTAMNYFFNLVVLFKEHIKFKIFFDAQYKKKVGGYVVFSSRRGKRKYIIF